MPKRTNRIDVAYPDGRVEELEMDADRRPPMGDLIEKFTTAGVSHWRATKEVREWLFANNCLDVISFNHLTLYVLLGRPVVERGSY